MAGSSKNEKAVEGSDPTAKLTDDLLIDNISRVPYKSTCCCKCVSTRWRDLISHPDHRKMPQSLAGFLYESYNADRLPRKARIFINESRKGYPFIDPSLSFLPNYQSLDIVDGCNGLLLCRCWKAADPKTLDYIVCNPATEKWVVVPATDWSCKVSVARLGFDPAVSSHFHVFEFIKQKAWGIDDEELSRWDDEYIVALAIYSSKAGAWKHQTAECDPFEIPENATSAFLNGIMHFAVFDDLMVVVDVEGDNWWRVPIPMKTTNVRIGDIFPSQGQLYFASNTLYCDDTPTELDVWVLEDYDSGKWTLTHNVSHLQLLGRKYSPYVDDYSIISIHPEHNLIFIVCGHEKTLMSYDMDSGERCVIILLGWDCRPPYVPYVPLFS